MSNGKRNYSLILWGAKGFLAWTIVVACAWIIFYPLGGEGKEAAGFLMIWLGFPSSLLLNLFDCDFYHELILLSFLGFPQWIIFGVLYGIKRRARDERR